MGLLNILFFIVLIILLIILINIFFFVKTMKLFGKLIIFGLFLVVLFFAVVFIANNFFDAGWLNNFLVSSEVFLSLI